MKEAVDKLAPINIVLHYPPPGQYKGKGGAVLTLKLVP